MDNPIKYGIPPYQVAVVHGGPGATGTMEPVAKVLSRHWGVLEPLQNAVTVEGQINELHMLLESCGDEPFVLIGHSWGAWLSYMLTARYPGFIKKLILIGSAPFEEKYVSEIWKTRYERLTEKERFNIQQLQKILDDPLAENKDATFSLIGKIIARVDSFNPIHSNEIIHADYSVFQQVWNEAVELRKNGLLLPIGRQILCPVTAIHGDYDPHHYSGVKMPLSETLNEFRFYLLKNCGHKPWQEKNARENFYDILIRELS